MTYRRLAAVTTLILVVGTALYFASARPGTNGTSDGNLLADVRSERYRLKRLGSLSERIMSQVLYPVNVQAEEGVIYVTDWAEFRVKRFDKHGALVNTIGKGEGQGPGEFTVLGAFDVYRDTLWVLDPRARAVTVFENSGRYVDRFNVEGNVDWIAVTGGMITLSGFVGDIFYAYNRQGRLVANFGKLIEVQHSNPLVVDGNLATGKDDKGFVYQPAYASYLYAVGDTAVLDTARTLDGQDYPAARRPSAHRISAPTPPIRYGSVSVSEGRVYVLANADSVADGRRRGVKYSYLDVYERETFAYEGSVQLPLPTKLIEVANDTLYTIADADTVFTAYTIKPR